jgi:hypothetical protein
MRNLKIGDVVSTENNQKFVILDIKECIGGYNCPVKGCPGRINDRCYGHVGPLRYGLKLYGTRNPNSNIVIQEV